MSDELDEGDPFPDLDAASALRAAFKQRGCAATAARGAAPGVAAAVDRQGYALEGEIARGGMGVIVKAFDRDLTRDVALKVLRDELTGEARCVRRFFEEARITARLDHPGIVPVHQVGLDPQGRPYFAMRLVRGRDLGRIISLANANANGWSQTRALSVILKVCEAMAYAHDKGVIHRDLKPSNVMVGEFGEVYVMDWGLARAIGGQDAHDLRLRERSPASAERGDHDSALVTMDGDVLGTPCFMAPEQAQGRIAELGPRSDVYSVGAMLYHLLANAMPYVPAGASVGSRAVLDQLLQGPPRALFELRRDLPAELVAICERAMARDAQDRYPGMSNMADDLRAFLERRVVHAYETGAWAEAKMWVRRNKSLAASLAVAVLLLIAGLTASLVFKARSDENARIAAANEVRATEREQLALWRAADLAVATRTAQENEQVATQKANDVLSLSAIQDLMELADRADALWPASPENLPLYEAWLSDARILIEGQADDPVRGVKRRPGLAEHAAKLAEIRSRGRPVSADPGDAPRLPERASSLEYEFEDSGDRWWHAQLSKLVSDLEAFRDEQRGGLFSAGTSEEHGWGIEKRLEFARTIAERSVSGPQARARWEEASAAIEKLPEYRSLKLEPQLGLLPIGADPDSGLWEFAHLQTGDPAERDAHGKLVVDEAMGLVFVLLPGGTFPMGAQSADPAGANYDPQAVSLDEAPVHEVTLSPYFLSKYEMTQGQWRRFTGQNPSNHGPTQYSRSWNRAGKGWTALHPVEQVSWTQCMEVMARLGLSLPSEAQWENGARGGTDTPYWTGWDLESLLDAANLSDAYGKSHGNHAWNLWEKDLDDGNTSHAEIGSYRANPFGLHEVIGNVGEWCLDGYDAGFYARSPRLDPVNLSTGAPYRVLRGGGFNDDASRARSAIRNENAPEVPVFVLGLRPARALEPPPAASPSSEE